MAFSDSGEEASVAQGSEQREGGGVGKRPGAAGRTGLFFSWESQGHLIKGAAQSHWGLEKCPLAGGLWRQERSWRPGVREGQLGYPRPEGAATDARSWPWGA